MFNKLYNSYNKFRAAVRISPKEYFARQRIFLLISTIIIATTAVVIFFALNKPVEVSASWYNDSWLYRKTLTIDPAQVAGDLTDFPVLVSFTDSDVATSAQETGDDIIFIDSSGEKLAHEIESYASSTGTLVVWVKVSSLSSTEQTQIYMYYGNAGVGSQENTESLWHDYYGVWHLPDDATASTTDSSGNNPDGFTEHDASSTPNSKIGGGFQFDGSYDRITVPDNDSLDGFSTFSMSAWVNADDLSEPRGILSKYVGGATTEKAYMWRVLNSGQIGLYASTNGSDPEEQSTTNASIATGSWYYVSFSFNNGDWEAYQNGQDLTEDADFSTITTINDSSADLLLGFGYLPTSYVMDGGIDEARISKKIRSQEWFATEYNNQNDPASFFSVSAQEQGKGPVGYWSFDEGYGTTANDNSGQGNNGTITGAAWTDESQCVSGKCLYFDGVDGTHVEINPYNNLESGTACFWLKANSLTNEDSDTSIVLLDGDIFLRFDNSGNLRMFVSTSGVYPNVYGTAESNIEINSWYYVCGVYNGIGVNPKLFINGKDASTLETAGTGTDNVQSSYDIGQNSGTEGQFHGFLDEVKIYPYARSADEIKADYNAGLSGMQSNTGVAASFGGASDKWMSDGLVGYWKFDESSTSTAGAIDSSGNGNDGIYEGNASTTAGKFGNGGVFDGTGDYVTQSTLLDTIPDNITIVGWFKPDATGMSNTMTPIGKVNISTEDALRIDFTMSGASPDIIDFAYEANNGGTNILDSQITWVSGAWYQVAISWSNINGISFYINGELKASNANATDLPNDGTYRDFTVGAFKNDGTNLPFKGQIDEVRVYNRALSPDEVQKLYEWAPGPVAHWKFDEMSGTTAYDSVASSSTAGGNDGTISGASFARGKYGGDLDFDGVNDYVSVSSEEKFDFENNDAFSLMAWIKVPSAFGTWNCIVCKQDSGTGYEGYGYSLDSNGRLTTYINSDIDTSDYAAVRTDSSISYNEWQHVVLNYDGSKSASGIDFYINGVSQSKTTINDSLSGSILTDFDMIIGARENENADFYGEIDDVRIYNYARTQKQILEDMNGGNGSNGSKGLKGSVLHLKFDEGRGATAYDSSIHQNNGTLYPGTGGSNTASSAMWSLDGHSKGAMEFDGVDDYVDLGDIDALDTLGEITASAWVNWKESTGVREYVLAKSASGFYSWQLLIENAPGRFAWTTNTGAGPVESNTDYIPDNNRWYHLVGVYDGSNQYLYVDGDLVDSDAQTGAMSDYSSSLLVGAEPDTPYEDFFHGLIDEVQIWNYALTAEEVKTVYNDTKGAVWGSTGQSASTATSSNAKSLEYCVPGSTDPCAAPVLELKFDEYGGTTAYDTSGNGNDGTLTWMSTSTRGGWVATGKKGSALSFDGVDDYVETTNLDLAVNGTGTISAWIKNTRSSCSGSNYYYAMSDDHVGRNGIGYILSDCDLNFRNNQDNILFDFSDNGLNANDWHHVVAVSDNTHQWLYVDGILRSDAASAAGLDIDGNYIIGWGGDYFQGLIDEVKIYNYARTPAQIAWDYNGGEPVAHWAFNECKGSTIYDSSVHANHGTLNLGTSGTTATGTCAVSASSFWYNGRSGAKNAGGYFDGTDDYIDVGDTGINVNSVAFWFKQDYTDADIIDLDGGTHTVTLADSKVTATGFSSPTIYVNGQPATAIPNSGWHHVLVTTATTIDASNLDIARIGTDYFTGQLDEVKLWTYPLTATQTKTEYAGGAISFGSRPSQSGEALASSWTCGDSVYNDNDSITYSTVLADDGNCWLASNLGTANIATAYNDSSAYGAYYQWGRLADGHQISTSGTTGTNSSGDVPGHDDFITESSSPYDWRVPQNDNLWQGVDGTNNPCPAGWRIPTQTEWATLVSDEVITDYTTAFSSSLKLTVAGYRHRSDGSLLFQGSYGHHWSSSPFGSDAYRLYFGSSGVDPAISTNRAYGLSARCLKN